MQRYKGYSTAHSNSISVENFLSTLLECSGVRGITWAELYIIYRLRGHSKPLKDPGNAASRKHTPAKQIAAFKREVRATTSRIMQDSEDEVLFKAYRADKDGMKGVGIS